MPILNLQDTWYFFGGEITPQNAIDVELADGKSNLIKIRPIIFQILITVRILILLEKCVIMI